MDKKPNVFPDGKSMSDAMNEANEIGTRIAEQANSELNIDVTNIHKSKGEQEAEYLMKKNTIDNMDEQIRLMDELLAKKKAAKGPAPKETIKTEVIYNDEPKIVEPVIEKTENFKETIDAIKAEVLDSDSKYDYLSKPQDNVPYDVINLPSEGLLYKNQKKGLKLAYLNAMDESIMTNPNLLQSGKFLEILINRKMLDTDLKYQDLHIGDRNAIMIWLRSTGYGPMYNIVLSDPNDPNYQEFNVDVDLSKIKVKNLGAKPNKDGHFERTLPVSGSNIKFRLLNVRDIDEIDEYIEKMEAKLKYNDGNLFTLKKHIVEVDGDTDKEVISKFVERMRLGDVLDLREYVNSIESGMDMRITVRTPGGESVETFLPLNITFFWPNLRL